jgi:AraC-like DNA-binding protein
MCLKAITPVALRDAAAQPVYERIRRDREKVPSRFACWLAVIEENLFDPCLNVSFVKKCVGVKDNSVGLEFHTFLGFTPKRYITDCRLSVAANLLSTTRLKIFKISDLLGYSNLGVFGKAFVKLYGQPASQYRLRHAVPEDSRGDFRPSRSDVLRILDGKATVAEARVLIAHLQSIYPGSTGSNQSASGT